MTFVTFGNLKVTWNDYVTKHIGEYDKEKQCFPEVIVLMMLSDVNTGADKALLCLLHIYYNKTVEITDINLKYINLVELGGYTENLKYDLSPSVTNVRDDKLFNIIQSVANDLQRGFGNSKTYSEEELYNIIVNHFGVSDKPEEKAGATWLLTDGKFLQLGSVPRQDYFKWRYPYHFEVDDWLEHELNINTRNFSEGIMCDVYNAMRLNRGINGNEHCYVLLNKERPTSAQQHSLLDWLWICYDEGVHDNVEVNSVDDSYNYYFNEEDPPKILRAINRYYNTGELI